MSVRRLFTLPPCDSFDGLAAGQQRLVQGRNEETLVVSFRIGEEEYKTAESRRNTGFLGEYY